MMENCRRGIQGYEGDTGQERSVYGVIVEV